MLRFTSLLPACLALLPIVSVGDDNSKTRQFKPLEAKVIAIRTAAKVERSVQDDSSAARLRKEAWQHFDLREWDKAFEVFLEAIEKDPYHVPAAEGLAMSLYHSGDYASAFRLGQELKLVMPSVDRIIGETVTADVRSMIKEGEYDAANEFLAHFPAEDAKIASARQLVADADTITTALGPDGHSIPDPVSSKRFVKN